VSGQQQNSKSTKRSTNCGVLDAVLHAKLYPTLVQLTRLSAVGSVHSNRTAKMAARATIGSASGD
jgi:hypothetical protein